MASRFLEAQDLETISPMPVTIDEFCNTSIPPDSDSDLDFEGFQNGDSKNESSESESSDPSDSENEAQLETSEWSEELTHTTTQEFNSPFGKTFNLPDNARQIDTFSFLFGEEIIAKIVYETNLYARQKLEGNQQRLEKWHDTTAAEIKAYLGVCIIMGINSLPSIADFWSSDPMLGNDGVKKVMTMNHSEEIGQFLHFSDSSSQPMRGKVVLLYAKMAVFFASTLREVLKHFATEPTSGEEM